VAKNDKVINAITALLDNEGEWKNELKKIAEGLGQARAKGSKLMSDLDAAREGLKEIDSRAVHFSEDFGRRVGSQTKELGRKIDALVADVKRQPMAANLWERYREDIQPDATRLFIEYLDLLGGVSIRERGLAIKALADVCHLDELCALADWHFAYELTLCQDWDGPAFVALPGTDSFTDISAWPILRLGFASWSIWGLPLEGHEFGKLLADARMSNGSEKRKAHWKPYIKEFGERGTRVLIADSFAAWAEGPAYACALLFLVLNPNRSPARGVCDSDRAAVVLATLRDRATQAAGGGKRSAEGYDYLPFIEALEAKWGASCDSAGSPAERVRLLQDLPGVVQTHLDLQKSFDLKEWNRAGKVLTHLNEGQDIPVDLAAGVRHLTNAAWRGRFRATDGVGNDEAEKTWTSPEELEQRAMKAGIALIKIRDKKPPGTDTNSLKNPGR